MSQPKTIFAKDYLAPAYRIEKTDLVFRLSDHATEVHSRLEIRENGVDEPKEGLDAGLFLHGDHLELLYVKVNGLSLDEGQYELCENDRGENGLKLTTDLEDHFDLEIGTRIDPANNLALEGLYKSGDIYCTQMEAEGFRRVTYYMDRPDVMSIFRTRIEGDKSSYPQLLSNGNLVEHGDLPDGQHYAVWEDPYPKPCYLFALVAADLGCVEDRYVTSSGREVKCQVFVDKGNEGRAHHALASLKKAMKWDEDRFGLEYDLDLYMIVAVDAFNMGAMENKGLNIFNSSAVLADAQTATDEDFFRIESIVAHEYFHNWTGNRVTCRDWFQLTLKEGLTVYRDQEFSMDHHHPGVCRINDVSALRERQFAEDSGPNAHPIKPASYFTINNFYTATVYEKGAEVIRMMATLLGRDGFRKGMDLYFERHDGQAVCTENFVAAMADANSVDLAGLEASWYHQAGTPRLLVKGRFDEVQKKYVLNVEQVLPDQAGEDPIAYDFPLQLALLSDEGEKLPLEVNGESLGDEAVLRVNQLGQNFVFEGLDQAPTLSMMRNYSAPVIVEQQRDLGDMIRAIGIEDDDFNRYELIQEIMMKEVLSAVGQTPSFDGRFFQAMRQMLEKPMEHAIKAELLNVPSLSRLLEESKVFDPLSVSKAREAFRSEMADFCKEEFLDLYDRLCKDGDASMEASDVARRSLKNTCLAWLGSCPDGDLWKKAWAQMKGACNMTDRMSAFRLLMKGPDSFKHDAIALFEELFQSDPLVMNKFFAVQSSRQGEGVLEDVLRLEQHACYDAKNPNKVRALLGGFGRNLVSFHAEDGSGYDYLSQRILSMDEYNPSMASALARFYAKYPVLKLDMAVKMEAAMKKILLKPGLSSDTYEIVSKTLSSRG